jgi:hypothetical protein
LTVKSKILSLSLAFLFSCAPAAPEIIETAPEGLIPKNEMTNILTDVHIIEGARIGKMVLGDSLYALDHYKALWKKHHISEAIYDSSFQYYSRNAELMDEMYEEVLTRLTTMTSELQGTIIKAKEGEEDDEEEGKEEEAEDEEEDKTETEQSPELLEEVSDSSATN